MGRTPIRYTGHAKRRLRERRVARSQVRRALAIGVRSKARGDALKVEARIGERRLRVIYREEARGVLVITAYWMEPSVWEK